MFYVYFKHVRDSYGESTYLAAFVNRETIDEWWRKISTSLSSNYGNVKRVSPQYYVQKGQRDSTTALYAYRNEVPDIFIIPLDSPVTLPPISITDHINGGWYFVRSIADPFSHWYLRVKGDCLVCGVASCDAIHVSSEYRTRFCVRVRNPTNGSQASEDLIMIGSDEVSITGPKGHILYIDDGGDLKAVKGYQDETDLLFGDLRNRFISRAEKQASGEVWEYVESVERGEGEPWELVD